MIESKWLVLGRYVESLFFVGLWLRP